MWRALAFLFVLVAAQASTAAAHSDQASQVGQPSQTDQADEPAQSSESDDSASTGRIGGRTRFELSPFVGLRSAGSFRGEDQTVSYDIHKALTFGALFDYQITNQLAAEVLWGYQGSNVVKRTPVLPSTSGSAVAGTSSNEGEKLFDLSIQYFQGGLRFGAGNDTYEPYVATGVGVASFGPDLSGNPDVTEVSTIRKLSFSLGAGLVAYVHERIAIRGEARAFGTRFGDRQEDIACGAFGCIAFTPSATFWQSQFVGAVVIRF